MAHRLSPVSIFSFLMAGACEGSISMSSSYILSLAYDSFSLKSIIVMIVWFVDIFMLAITANVSMQYNTTGTFE